MGFSQGIGAAVLITLMYWDWRFRVAPNWLTIPSWIAGMILCGDLASWLSIGIFTMMIFAGFPGGDCKAVAAISVFFPLWALGPALLVSFVLTIVLMESRWYNLYQQAHRWPWLCGFGTVLTISFTCGTLLGK